jgi:hypothetical protein
MSETAGMRNGMDMGADDDSGLDARSAAAIMRDAGRLAKSELTVNSPLLFLSWGLVYLLGYGAVWLGVRGQHPYQAPAGWSLGVIAGLVLIASIVTASVLDRATAGVGGESSRRRRIAFMSMAIGWIAVIALAIGLKSAGVSASTVGVIGASGPILVAGLVFAGTGLTWKQWPDFGLGAWLIALTVGGAFAGAAGAWGIDAVAAGVGYLAAGAITGWLARS